MSCELLVVAGPPSPSAAESRRSSVEHAATLVPGVQSWTVFEGPTACAALVTTSPDRGTFVRQDRDTDGTRLTVATSSRGLVAARSSDPGGAEAGHVSVLLTPDGSLRLTNDRVGFLPCYWGPVSGGVVASTHLASLVSLGLAPDPDPTGVVEYLALHHPLGTRTLLREGAMLPAGGDLRWQPGVPVTVHDRPIFVPDSDSMSDDDVIAAFAEVWPQIVGDAFAGTGTTALGLSGGLDSRAIAESAVQAGIKPVTYTYGTAPSHEPVAASRVARALGLHHTQIPVRSQDRLLGGGEALPKLDGAHSPSEMYELWFASTLRSFSGTVVNGLAGGTLWGDDKASGLTEPDAVLDKLWQRYSGDARTATRFLVGDIGRSAPGVLKASLSSSLSGWDLRARDDMVIYWRLANRQCRWGNMLTNALRRSGLRTEAPFLDARFLSLAARVTPEQRRNGGLYLRVHRELFPRTAGIARSDDGNAPRALDHVYWSGESSYGRQLAGLAWRHPVSGARRATRIGGHMARDVLRTRTGVSGPADRSDARRSVFPSDLWLRTDRTYAERLCELLELGDHPLIDGDAVADQVRAIRRGEPALPALALGRVAAASAWLTDYERRAEARVTAGV